MGMKRRSEKNGPPAAFVEAMEGTNDSFAQLASATGIPMADFVSGDFDLDPRIKKLDKDLLALAHRMVGYLNCAADLLEMTADDVLAKYG